MTYAVYIVSDSNIFLSAVEQSLGNHFDRIEKFSAFSDVVSNAIDWNHAVLIVDSGNPKQFVFELAQHRPALTNAKIIVLMRANQTVDDYRSVISHLGGLLPDSASVHEIALTARIVGQGIVLLPQVAVTSLFSAASGEQAFSGAGVELAFTDREQAVLALISKGASNKLIGRQLDISESTVRVHVRGILRKLGMQNRTQAALYAAGRKSISIGAELLRPSSNIVSAIA